MKVQPFFVITGIVLAALTGNVWWLLVCLITLEHHDGH